MLAATLASLAIQSSGLPCRPQLLPAEALAPTSVSQSITFSAKPVSEVPGGAWVVRLSRERYVDDASVEIVRLRLRQNCNRWDIVKSWRASIPAGAFEALGRQLMPYTVPGAGTPAAGDPFQAAPEAATGGTTITLKLSTHWWNVSRNLHAAGRSGAPVSALFHDILSNQVPEAERPTRDWRTKGG